MPTIEQVQEFVEKGKTKLITQAVEDAIGNGLNPLEILQSMIDAMGVVGDKFSKNLIFVPEMLIAAKTMSKGVAVLKPHLAGGSSTSLGTCIIGTVQGDLHDIGKNLVAMMLESVGFTVVDLGVDVPAEKFIEAVKANEDVRIVACSGLLTTTMGAMRQTVAALKNTPSNGFKVVVGGAPVTEEFALEIGADMYAPDAGTAAAKAKSLVTEMMAS